MKPIDKDAKLLILSYIDNIERYLTIKSKMHPNIIDGILNEINDFIYIRSTELAKDKILYSDVLKAIDECGSPSDICEQYLENEVVDSSQISQNQTSDEKSRSLLKKKVTKQDVTIHAPYSYFDQLQRFPIFGLYRISAVFLYLLFILIVISGFVQMPSYRNFSLQDMRYLCMHYYFVVFWTFIFFLIEGWLVNDWKNRKEIQGFVRTQDDFVVIIISRFSILILSLKASLLPIPEYFFIIFPILLILLLWMERQQASDLWITKISIMINNFARSVEAGRISEYFKQSLNDWIRSINTRSKLERVYFLLTAFYFAFSWLFPCFYGWYPLYFPFEIFLYSGSSFTPDHLVRGLDINITLPFILLIGGIIVSNIKNVNTDGTPYKLISSNIWIMRIIVLRTILMVLTYRFYSVLMITMCLLIVLWLLFEFSVNREQNKILMQTIVNGLNYLGSDRKPYISPERVFSSPVRSEPSNGGNQHVDVTQSRTLPPVQRETIPESSQVVFNETVPLIDYNSPFVKIARVVFPTMARFTVKIASLCILALYTIAKPVYTFGKALTVTTILLFGSIIETILVILAILTQLGTDGSYLVPTFTFDLPYGWMFIFGGFVIWSWYVLGILAAQIFILVMIEWFQFARKKDDGVILMFFRNISRILLFIIVFGSIYQGWYYFDTYAPLRIFSIIILVIFMEITSLKIRIERKHWQETAVNNDHDIGSTESDVQSNSE